MRRLKKSEEMAEITVFRIKLYDAGRTQLANQFKKLRKVSTLPLRYVPLVRLQTMRVTDLQSTNILCESTCKLYSLFSGAVRKMTEMTIYDREYQGINKRRRRNLSKNFYIIKHWKMSHFLSKLI
jgi:hypothetical protein